jgi:hypothetical protein
MDPSTFLQTLSGGVASELASVNQIAMGLSQRTAIPIRRQAIHGCFSEASTAFLTGVMHRLFGQCFSCRLSNQNLSGIRRILVEDSSVQVMPNSLLKNPSKVNACG